MEEHEVLHIISRAKAKELGMTYYFSGKPCKNGHYSKRWVITKNCTSCAKEYNKKWKLDNDSHVKEYGRKYRDANYDKLTSDRKQWYIENRPHCLEYAKDWRRRNPDAKQSNEYRREYHKIRYKKDPLYKCSRLIRGQMRRVVNAAKYEKNALTEKVIGYSVSEFKEDMDSKMLVGMTWDGHGDCWEIDHITPISRLLSMGIKDPAIINSLNNLAPMWKKHNMDKRDKTLEEWLSEKGEDSKEYQLYGHYLTKE